MEIADFRDIDPKGGPFQNNFPGKEILYLGQTLESTIKSGRYQNFKVIFLELL